MPSISVIIPAYNAENGLVNCLESMLQQTYKDFELIIINDGSTDGTAHICNHYAEVDSRIHVIHNENMGVAISRNIGIEKAGGEFITFIDADDYVDSNYLYDLFSVIGSNDVAICDVSVEDNNEVIRRFTLEPTVLSQTELMQELFVRRNLNSGPCAKLFRKDVIGDIRFPLMKAYEDIIFVKNVFSIANTAVATNKTTYHYIQNSSGAMSGFRKSPSLDIVNATDDLLKYITEHKELSPDCFYITASHLMQYVIPMLPEPVITEKDFINATQSLYRKYFKHLIKCEAFPFKEKLVYMAFVFGIIRHNKKVTPIRYSSK